MCEFANCKYTVLQWIEITEVLKNEILKFFCHICQKLLVLTPVHHLKKQIFSVGGSHR